MLADLKASTLPSSVFCPETSRTTASVSGQVPPQFPPYSAREDRPCRAVMPNYSGVFNLAIRVLRSAYGAVHGRSAFAER